MESAERLKIEILLLLYARPDGVPLDELEAQFLNFHGCHFDLVAYGYHSLKSLLEDMDGTVHLCDSYPSPRLRACVADSPAYSGPSRSQNSRPTLPEILPQQLLAFVGPSLLLQPSWPGPVPPCPAPLSFGAPMAYIQAGLAACHPSRFPAAPGGVNEAPPMLSSPSGPIGGWPRLRTRPQAPNPGLAPQSSNGANTTDPKQTLTYSQALQRGAAGWRRGGEGRVREGWGGDFNLQTRSGTSLNLNGRRNLSTRTNLPQESPPGRREKASTVQKGPRTSSPPDLGQREVLENPRGVREQILELLDGMPDGMSFFELRRSCVKICGRSAFTGDCPDLKTWLGTVGIEVLVLGLGVQARIHVSGHRHLSDAA